MGHTFFRILLRFHLFQWIFTCLTGVHLFYQDSTDTVRISKNFFGALRNFWRQLGTKGIQSWKEEAHIQSNATFIVIYCKRDFAPGMISFNHWKGFVIIFYKSFVKHSSTILTGNIHTQMVPISLPFCIRWFSMLKSNLEDENFLYFWYFALI